MPVSTIDMNFALYTIILTYVMASLAVASVALIESIPPAFIVFLSGATVVSLALNLTRRALIPKWLWNVLAGLILLLFLADYAVISRSLLVSAARFLAVLTVLKLFDLKTNRDHLVSYVLVFFLILAASASTVSISFVVILGLFVVSGTWAMIIFNIKRDWATANARSPEVPGRVFGVRFFAFVAAASVATIILTFALFFAIPRAGLGFLEKKTGSTLKVTGFSDTVDLGDLGAVKKDQTVVMRVGIKTGRPKSLLRFRGTQLDYYNGRTWSRRVMTLYNAQKQGFNRFLVGSGVSPLLEQEILLEPLDTDVIFAASNPVFIQGKFANVRVDWSGSLYLPSPPYSRLEYIAWSDITHPKPEHNAVPDGFKDTTFVDTDPSGPRIKELTVEVTKGAKTDLAKATAIESYLKGTFDYTLDPPHTEGKSPLEDFLFYAKKGYCEHYASAMVVMLRAAGIPSRLVTGFLEGDWNDYGGYYIIRQENAHSWVEAHIKGSGWVTFDPTPGPGLSSYDSPSAFSLYLDMLRWKWNRNIVHFTLNDQMSLAVVIERGIYSYYTAVKKTLSWDTGTRQTDDAKRLAPKTLLAAVILFIAIAAAFVVIRRRTGARGKLRGTTTPQYYIEMTRILKRRGMERRPGETPTEFAVRVDRPEVTTITRAHEAERYKGRFLDATEIDGIKKNLETIKKDDGTANR